MKHQRRFPLAARLPARLRPCLVGGLAVAVTALCWHAQGVVAGRPLAPASPGVTTVPANCVEHFGSGSGDLDYAGDFRCAGLAIDYHTAGVARSPRPIWAGQWLFVDEAGGFRTGSCVFNRGIHPTIDQPSMPVNQPLPLDPGGAKSSYLLWRYGATTDALTAAGLWAVFHFYAQDAAGSNRATNPSAPLVPALDQLREMSGRQDIERRALVLDREAARLSAPFTLTIEVDAGGHGAARLRAGAEPVSGIDVALTVSGAAFDDESTSFAAVTDGDGAAAFEVIGPAHEITITATATAPGPVQVYRAAPADPVGHLPQTLVTAGAAQSLQASVSVVLAGPATTTTPTTATSTEATTTTEAATTTTEAPTTTESPTTTELSTPTTEPGTTTTTELPATTEPGTTSTTSTTSTAEPAATTTAAPVSTTTAPPPASAGVEQPPPTPRGPVESLPRTGSSGGGAAYLGTSMLVAGIGVLGAIRRRSRAAAR